MEDYGIGGAAKMALLVLAQASRRSGRTSRLVERAQPGDRIIVSTEIEKRRVQQLLTRAGKIDVAVRVCSPLRDERAWHLGTNPTGITLFDADWVEQWYLNRIERAQLDFEKMQGALSKDRKPPPARDDWSMRFDRYELGPSR